MLVIIPDLSTVEYHLRTQNTHSCRCFFDRVFLNNSGWTDPEAFFDWQVSAGEGLETVVFVQIELIKKNC